MILIISFFVVVVAFLYQLKNCALDPVKWSEPSPLPSLEGPLAPNEILKNIVLKSGDFAGPEAFAVHPISGNVYASFNDGTVGEFQSDGTYLRRIFFTGGYLRQSDKSNGINYSTAAFRKHCNIEALAKRLAWNTTGERECGRPLGLRVRQENSSYHLYLLDAYHGLFKLDLVQLTAQHLVTPNTPISSPVNTPDPDPSAMAPLVFFNDLDILESMGVVVFSDSSTLHSRSENRAEIMEGRGRGRLLTYALATAQLTVLLCGLHFPNGVQHLLSSDHEVLVVETTRYRILRANLTALAHSPLRHTAHCGEHGALYEALQLPYATSGVTVFAQSVPGFGDNLRASAPLLTGKKDTTVTDIHYLVPLFTKSVLPFSLPWFGYQHPWLVRLIGGLVPARLFEHLVPRYGLLVAYDGTGTLLYSLQDPSGVQGKFSHAERHPVTGDVWLGSHSEEYLSILPAPALHML